MVLTCFYFIADLTADWEMAFCEKRYACLSLFVCFLRMAMDFKYGRLLQHQSLIPVYFDNFHEVYVKREEENLKSLPLLYENHFKKGGDRVNPSVMQFKLHLLSLVRGNVCHLIQIEVPFTTLHI